MNTLSSETLIYSLAPRADKIFETSFNIISEGEDGDANKELSCSYDTLEIPRKEVCG